MGYITASTHLNVPIDTVWAFLNDVLRNPEWEDNVQTVSLLTEGPVTVNTVFRERLRILGPFHAEGEWRITVLNPPALHEHQGNVPITGETTVRYTLEPADKGCGCKVEVTYELRPGRFSGALDLMLIRPGVTRAFRNNLRRMKRVLEKKRSH